MLTLYDNYQRKVNALKGDREAVVKADAEFTNYQT